MDEQSSAEVYEAGKSGGGRFCSDMSCYKWFFASFKAQKSIGCKVAPSCATGALSQLISIYAGPVLNTGSDVDSDEQVRISLKKLVRSGKGDCSARSSGCVGSSGGKSLSKDVSVAHLVSSAYVL